MGYGKDRKSKIEERNWKLITNFSRVIECRSANGEKGMMGKEEEEGTQNEKEQVGVGVGVEEPHDLFGA